MCLSAVSARRVTEQLNQFGTDNFFLNNATDAINSYNLSSIND